MAEDNVPASPSGDTIQVPENVPSRGPADTAIGDSTTASVKEGAVESDGMSDAPQSNGTTEQNVQQGTSHSEHPTEVEEEARNPEDTEMRNSETAGEAAEAAEVATSPAAAPVTNGNPAVSKRASVGGSAKKKSSAVPEHKSKKLNKKKSKPLTNLNAQPGEYYIARMKGHPPWPSIICDEDMLPHSLLSTRPVTAQLPDGSFKKPEYAEGGKRAYERTYPIMFLHTNEFAWIPNTELAPLDVESDAVKNPVEKGKSKTLLQAYKKAADNEDLDHYKGMLADHAKAIEADQQEREELEKERAAKKAKKAARKSDAAVNDDEDMDVDEDVAAEKPKSKKRKKAEDSDEMDEKPLKTPKTTTKIKMSMPKTPATEPSTKKKSSKSKSAKAVKSASEDDAMTPKAEEKPLTAQQLKENKEKKVLYYRHKLQRGFLSRDNTPRDDEMKTMSEFLADLEGYPDLEGSIIRATKIHKVLKAMIKLPSIPLDEDYHFKTRSVELLGKWNEILSNDTSAGPSGDKDEETKGGDAAQAAGPTTNGATEGSEKQAKEAEAGEAAAPEEETEAKLENKIGTTVEGEKEAEKPEDDDAEAEKTAEEKKTDAPAVDSAPAEAYQPEETAEATA